MQPKTTTDRGPDDVLPRGAMVVAEVDGRQQLLTAVADSYRVHEPRTHDELTRRAARWLRNTRRCSIVLQEPRAFWALEIPDAIGFRSDGRSIVVEAKVTRVDFLGDKHKRHRRLDRASCGRPGMGIERWYLIDGHATEAVWKPGDELHGWGVLECRGSRCYKRVQPRNLARQPDPELALLVAKIRRMEADGSQ